MTAPRPATVIEQRRVRGHLLRAAGLLAWVLGTINGVFALGFLRKADAGPPWQGWAFGWPQAMVELAMMLVLLPVGRRLVRQGGRHLAPVLEAIPESERIVLFLRAFSDDEGFAHVQRGSSQGPWTADLSTEEEQIARAVAPFGPLIALGRPGESLPQVGAARRYTSDDTWQQQVLTGLDRADLVLLACGPGPGLLWEVEQVVARDQPERLVLVIVRDIAQYESFKAVCQSAFPQGLPDFSEAEGKLNDMARDAFTRAVIWFDADWTPHVSPLHFDADIEMLTDMDRWVETAFPLAIRPVYDRAGLAMPGLPSGPRTRPSAVIATVVAHGLTAMVIATLLLREAEDVAGVLVVLALALVLPGLLLARVWRGGYFSLRMAMFIGLFFGGLTALVAFVTMLLDGVDARFVIGFPLGIGLFVGGLLLRRRDVREWTASLVLFPPR